MPKLFALMVVALLASCGYHSGGKADLLPKSVHSIAIPAFSNLTVRFRLTDLLPQAIARELVARTRYQIATDPEQADAVVHGAVVLYQAFPTIVDPATSRQSAVEIHVTLQVSLVERATGKVLFSRPNLEMSERYQIAVDPGSFIEESDAAVTRASSQAARQVVSAILENF